MTISSNRSVAMTWCRSLALSVSAVLSVQGAHSEAPLSIPTHVLPGSLDGGESSKAVQKNTSPSDKPSSKPRTHATAKKPSAVAAADAAHIPNAYELGLAKPYDASQQSATDSAKAPNAVVAPASNASLSYKASDGAIGIASGQQGGRANAGTVFTVTPVTHVVVPGPEFGSQSTVQSQNSGPLQVRTADPLMAIASQIQTGRFPCELGQSIDLRQVAGEMAQYTLILTGRSYTMVPMVSQTGAIMLEDTKAGLKWIQLPNKSMLLSSKLGQRLADECQSPIQVQEANNLKLHPPQHLLAPKGETQYTINVVN